MQPSDDRPPIEYEKTTHALSGDLALCVSKALLPIPRFMLEIGRMRDGRMSRYIPIDQIDAVIEGLRKFQAERVPHMLDEVSAARAKADARRGQRGQRDHTAEAGVAPRQTRRERFRPRQEADLSEAAVRSAKASEANTDRWSR